MTNPTPSELAKAKWQDEFRTKYKCNCFLCEEKGHPFTTTADDMEEFIQDIIEKERWWSPCSGCPEGHPSFWKTIVESPQWQEWYKEQMKNPTRDIDESQECGWISPEHFQEFLKFTLSLKLREEARIIRGDK